MSVSRQVRRENKKVSNKHERKVDWTKIKKTSKTLLLVCLFFTLIVFSFTYYTVKTQNAIRKSVSLNPATTTAKVISISSGKGPHAATYHFRHKGKIFTGKSFHSFAGEVGQTVCIEYLLNNPNINFKSLVRVFHFKNISSIHWVRFSEFSYRQQRSVLFY